MGQNLS
jgi:hypothetical protein